MALIKCEECGKEFSDKASACPNCACPIQNNEKNEKEREIISIKLDIEKLQKLRKLYLIIGIILTCSVFGSPFGVFMLFGAHIFKVAQNNQLVLTNKRIKGSLTVFFNTQTINIPLERIDNIVVNKNSTATGIQIMSNNLKKGIGYVLNAEEFCDIAMKEIEKYKNK